MPEINIAVFVRGKSLGKFFSLVICFITNTESFIKVNYLLF